MAANFSPIYSRIADIQYSSAYVTNDSTDAGMASGDVYQVFQADSTNGGYVSKIRIRATPAGNTTATVMRVWINNSGATTSSSNNTLFDEITLPATTASATAATANYEVPMNIALPASYKIYVTVGTSTTNGWQVTVVGGKY